MASVGAYKTATALPLSQKADHREIVAILDVKGKVRASRAARSPLWPQLTPDHAKPSPQSLIQRSYRDDVSPSYIERFLPLILEMEEDNVPVTPCFSSEGINYMHIRHNNLYCGLVVWSRRPRAY